jgi:hypothetical protein
MEKHIRFYIDLAPDDAALLVKLALHYSNKNGVVYTRVDAVRSAIRSQAKKEHIVEAAK